MSPIRVAIVGSGVWGAAFGRAIASDQCHVTFWDRNPARAIDAAAAAANASAVDSLPAALPTAADVIIIAVSSAGFAGTLRQLAAASAPLLWLTKGLSPDGEPLSNIAAQTLPSAACYGVISGPSFAAEISQGLPAALTLAVNRAEHGETLRDWLHRPRLRLYLNDDLIGVCVGGAVKNIIAIAAGISDGMQLGENARAALLARGLAEMSAVSEAFGGRRDTLLGLAGVGDLALTCCSDLSRNRRLGLALATGAARGGDTCEGANAAAALAAAARARGLDLPIIAAVADVLSGAQSPADAANALLARPPR